MVDVVAPRDWQGRKDLPLRFVDVGGLAGVAGVGRLKNQFMLDMIS